MLAVAANQQAWRRWMPPLATVAALFVADLAQSSLLTPALLYPVAVLLTLGTRDLRVAPGVGALATLLTVLARLAPRWGTLPSTDWTNRVITICAIWGMVALVRHLDTYRVQLNLVTARGEAEHVARERAQQRLEISLQELRDLQIALDQSSIVSMSDLEGRITYANDRFCAISGMRRDELLGRNHRIVSSGQHGPAFWHAMWQTISAGGTWRGEVRNRTRTGDFWWADTTIVPLLDGRGRPNQYVAIRADITARKEAEARLLEQNALARLGEMASVVAHEVRNPLAGVSGALQVLRERLPAASSERQVLADVLQRVDQLNGSLEALLQYARPARLQRTPTPLRLVLDDLLRSTRDDPRFAQTVVRCEVAEAPARGTEAPLEAGALIDAHLLRGALFNLVLNAAQSRPDAVRVGIRAQVTGGRLYVQVQDDGPGIAPELRARVLEPFFTTKTRGTGLGLPMVRRVVEQHGGTLQITCPATGGTCVELVLPA